ncbi:MAG: PAS domain S-box protein [Methanoregula sp.]|nr:PAS domain S-box protein [Methanoregula sp.]
MPDLLYVDDEPALLDIGKTFLEFSGKFRVDTVTTAKDALEKMDLVIYDGIISDYQMPDMNGIELLRCIRKKHKDLPFILFTGKGREEIAIEALNAGADFYLHKGGEPKSQFVELEHKLKSAIERKQTHNDLRESKQRMEDIINFLPDATFAIDFENKVIAWNRMMEEITGIPKDAILGKGDPSYANAIVGEDRPILVDYVLNKNKEIEKYYPKIEANGDKIISEVWSPNLNKGNGAHLWLIASPLYDCAGKVIGAIESIRDITSRKDAEEKVRRINEELHAAYEQLTATEEELRQNYDELGKSQQDLLRSEERYRDVVEDQTELICRFTPDGKLTFVNDAYCRYFNLDKAVCLENPHPVVLAPEDRQLIKQHFSTFTQKSPTNIIEHRIMMPGGEVRWQRWSDSAIFDNDGRIIEYQSVGRDTTDKIIAEEKLKRTNEELNSAYEQLTAIEEELRSTFEELSLNQQDLIRSEERYRSVVEDQTEFICRFTPDGTHIFVNDAYCRYFGKVRVDLIGHHFIPEIPDEDRPLLKVQFSSLTPDHPVISVEHRIVMPGGEVRWQHWSDRAIFDNKGKIVEYQSVGRDITDRKRLDKALFESNRKLNLLSSITRHEILNQLTALQLYQSLLKGKITDPECKVWIEKAVRVGEVIESQISFTQQYQDIGLQKPLWQDAYATAMSVCLDEGFLNVTIDEGLARVSVFSDPLFRTVFYNLFENAMMHGGKTTTIRVSGEAVPGGYALVVEDNGGGITPEDKIRIFDKGYGKHTGLGLFLAREVLAITGLSIEEVGEYGKGARFRILVPDGMLRKHST